MLNLMFNEDQRNLLLFLNTLVVRPLWEVGQFFHRPDGILLDPLEDRQQKNQKSVCFPFHIELPLFDQELISGRPDFIVARQRERKFVNE